jgi:hypothetical protein
MKKTNAIRYFLPPLKVHVWGGFGSQLFALIVGWRLSKRFKFRRIYLVFHSSGVTERVRELPSQWLEDFTVIEVRDFEHSQFERESYYIKQVGKSLREIAPLFLENIGFLNRANTDQDFLQIKPWLFEVRGHYTGFRLEESELSRLMSLLRLESHDSHSNSLSIHYRLGDLLSLSNKTYVKPNRVIDIVMRISEQHTPLVIFSDSTQDVLSNILDKLIGNRTIYFKQLPPIDTIRICTSAILFIGTNSKLSLWITLFRIMHGKTTAIPNELSDHVEVELGLDLQKQSNLIIY